MRTNSPSRKWDPLRAKLLLATSMAILFLGGMGGCAVLSIPSYRTNSLETGHFPTNYQDACVDCGTSQESLAASEMIEPCDEAAYVPVFPTLPMPGFLKRWKEQHNLPEGPNGLRFHPLPTRPMFSARPNGPATALSIEPTLQDPTGQNPTGHSSFGAIPHGSQWSDALQTSEIDSAAAPTRTPKKPQQAPPAIPSVNNESTPSSTEELPAPK